VVAALACIAVAAPAASADDAQAFKPVQSTDRHLVFRPHSVDVHAVVRAAVTYKVSHEHGKRAVKRTRRVPVRRVRRAVEQGEPLTVGKPRRARGGRLLIRSAKGADPKAPQTSCSFGTFSATNMPGACWRPYSDSSPFNRTVPAGAKPAANSSAIVSRVLGFGPASHMLGGVADTGDDWGQPIYYSQPSDPVYTVHCAEAWGNCEIEGLQVRIPSAAQPAAGGDAHMAVIDQAGGWEYDFWQVRSKPAGGGTITISWGGRTAIGTQTADGLGSNATAAHFGLAAGLIRLEELKAMQINHALAMVVKCTNGTSVWPAEGAVGTTCSSIGLPNADAPALGQHFYLAMSDAEIDALSVPQWKKAILLALAHYGAFVRDTGGGTWGFSAESGSSYTSFGYRDPWERLGDSQGVYENASELVFDLREGVDWTKLRAVDPCVAAATC
jgi:hypothetical protein